MAIQFPGGPQYGVTFGSTGLYGNLGPLLVHFGSGPGAQTGTGISPTPTATPVSPTIDPKLEANALYSKPMALFAGGFARIGAASAPLVGPYFNGDIVEFIVSFGVPANVEGDRKIYAIWLDNELAWSSETGGTLPGHGTFASQSFDFEFTPGTLTQGALSLESERFPGDECAYRPQMILQIRNLAWQRFFDITGKPVPYVAVDVGDVTDAAVPQDGINLGLALERIAMSPWAAMTPDEFEAVNVTDVVDAILIKDNFTVIELCQSITGEYRNLDLLVSDKVRIKDRGANVNADFIFDRDTIIGGDDALSVVRANATSQRREHELFAIDPDQDYTAVPSLAKIPRDPIAISAAVGKDTSTLPVVIDANTRQALATFALNYLENARRKLSFKVPVLGYEIEPGDLFALRSIANGFENEVLKVTQSTHGANWVVDIEAEAILRCQIFRENVVGTAVVASGDSSAGIRTCYVEGTAAQEWQGNSFMNNEDWPFYSVGYVIASSYAKTRGMPTFLMGGNDFMFIGFGRGTMMVSHDAINWTLVYDSEIRRVIYNIVWDAEEGAFYADFTGPVANGVTIPPATTICLRSETGYVWEEVAENFWSHAKDGKMPDGRAGYDPETDTTIMPGDLSLGKPIYCTAYANGVWLAGGGAPGDSVTFISYDGGASWSITTSGGGIGSSLHVTNADIRTMVAAPLSDITG